MTPPIEGEEVTTPDVPSSSPGIDAMDVSPLPHKAPYLITRVTLPSPSEDLTPDTHDGLRPDALPSLEQLETSISSSQPPTFLALPEYDLAFAPDPSCIKLTVLQSTSSPHSSYAHSRQSTVYQSHPTEIHQRRDLPPSLSLW